MEAFAEALKVLFEKRLIPTVMGVVIGLLVFAITPEKYYLLNKLGKELYIVLISGISFLVFTFAQFIIQKYPKWIKKRIKEQETREYYENKNKERAYELWDYMDGLREKDKEIIMSLLNNENKPLRRGANYRIDYFSTGQYAKDNILIARAVYSDNGEMENEYVLDEEFYNELLFIKEKFGKLSRFEEVDHG